MMQKDAYEWYSDDLGVRKEIISNIVDFTRYDTGHRELMYNGPNINTTSIISCPLEPRPFDAVGRTYLQPLTQNKIAGRLINIVEA